MERRKCSGTGLAGYGSRAVEVSTKGHHLEQAGLHLHERDVFGTLNESEGDRQLLAV
jgi:hypothetical protein